MNEIVSSIILLFSVTFKSGLPNKRKLQSAFESNLCISKPGIVSRRKRSLRIKSNWWQCRRRCSLFSLPLPRTQVELLQSKLCLSFCSFNGMKFTRSFVKCQLFDTFYIKNIMKVLQLQVVSFEFGCGLGTHDVMIQQIPLIENVLEVGVREASSSDNILFIYAGLS